MRGDELANRWNAINAKWFMPRWLDSRALFRELAQYRKDAAAVQARDIPVLVEALREINREDGEIARIGAGHEGQFAGAWPGVHGSLEGIDRYAAWSTRYQQALACLSRGDTQRLAELTRHLQPLVTEQRPLLQPSALVGQQLIKIREATLVLMQAVDAKDLVQNPQFAGGPHDGGFLVRVASEAQRWLGALRDLRNWCAWRSAREAALGMGLRPLVDDVEAGRVTLPAIVEQFEFSYRSWWLKKTVDRDPVLRTFSSADHARRIHEFRQTDADFQELTKRYIRARISADIPQPNALQPAGESEMGRLRREMRKAACPHADPQAHRRHADAAAAPEALRDDVAPVGRDLPRHCEGDVRRGPFRRGQPDPQLGRGGRDRARQAGGHRRRSKQLPPTSFFQKVDDLEEAAEEGGDVADLESILDECLGANLPSVDLRWHYRSKHEALISFSNAKYYEGKLITFPSNTTEDQSVVLRKVNGVYDRGGSRTNRIEAEAVVGDIERHYLDPARRHLSVGVVTFNQPQQQLIEQLLDARRRAVPALDAAIAERAIEPLFIKNLENVQGDERDRMLFSICYGRDAAGRLTMNFGPLNLEGGHRRSTWPSRAPASR